MSEGGGRVNLGGQGFMRGSAANNKNRVDDTNDDNNACTESNDNYDNNSNSDEMIKYKNIVFSLCYVHQPISLSRYHHIIIMLLSLYICTFPDPLGPTRAILLLCSMPRWTSANSGKEGFLLSFFEA